MVEKAVILVGLLCTFVTTANGTQRLGRGGAEDTEGVGRLGAPLESTQDPPDGVQGRPRTPLH